MPMVPALALCVPLVKAVFLEPLFALHVTMVSLLLFVVPVNVCHVLQG